MLGKEGSSSHRAYPEKRGSEVRAGLPGEVTCTRGSPFVPGRRNGQCKGSEGAWSLLVFKKQSGGKCDRNIVDEGGRGCDEARKTGRRKRRERRQQQQIYLLLKDMSVPL